MIRLSTVTMQHQGVNAILERQTRLNKTQLQVSTGNKILQPSDDPSNAALSLNLRQSVSMTEQYIRNSEMALSSVEIAETSLNGMIEHLQRARELTVQGLNDIQSTNARDIIAQEVRHIRAALASFANSKNAQDEYIFSGTTTDIPPVSVPKDGDFQTDKISYDGNKKQRQIQIGMFQKVIIRDAGEVIFGNFSYTPEVPAVEEVRDADGKITTPASPAIPATENIFQTLDELADKLENNKISSKDNFLVKLDAGLERVSRARARIGNRVNLVKRHLDVEKSFILNMKTTLSNINDVDMTKAISEFNTERIGMEAAQQAYIKVQGLSLFDYLR